MSHEDALAKVPLFSELGRRDLRQLAQSAVERRYKAGQTIVEEGEKAVAFFVLIEGKAEVVRSVGSEHPRRLNEVAPGGFFGEMGLLDGEPRAATVRALEDCVCLVLARWDFVAELRSNPHMAVAMLPVLSRRIRELDKRLEQYD
jgi:CRP/FNR family transcriptional regulator, cyclic AMP receptor protein